ncbi:MAG: hypothetical protein ACKOXH_07045 [Aquirufa sp.]
MSKFYILLFSCFTFLAQAQQAGRKGSYYAFWGYNRSDYPTSTIHFTGPGYDFSLANVVAADAPTPFDGFTTYFNPNLFSIPQFNLHAGYFIKDNLSISLGWDHMKYVMVPDQASHITGTISPQVSNPSFTINPAYVGNYNNTPFTIASKDFLQYEHTDGFNYASVELEHYTPLWYPGIGKLELEWMQGVGVGFVVPRSDVRLFTLGRNNYWNLAGAGASLKTGLRLNLTKLLFFEATAKGGYTNLWDVHTTGQSGDHAEQSIWFGEIYGALGFSFGRKK